MTTPLIEYRFRSINNNSITDHGTLGLNGSITGGCTIVDDPVMGPCLQFDGSSGFITLPDLNTSFTDGFSLTAWVNYAAFNNYSRIIDFGNGNADNNIVLYNGTTTSELKFSNYQQTSKLDIAADSALNLNEWMHLAVTVDAQGVCTVYVDGGAVTTQTNMAFLPPNVQRSSNFIGKSNWPNNGLFQGRMAWLALYPEALSAAGVTEDMNEALVERGAFRSTFPVNFSLTTDNEGSIAPVIYLEGSQNPELLTLSLQNCANSTLTLQAPKVATASSSNYHFQLLFRPGVISSSVITNGKISCTAEDATTGTAWQTSVENDSSGNTCLSLLATGSTLPQISASDSYIFTISGLQANPIGGTRATNVSLNYQQVSLGSTGSPLQGQRLQHLDIISHIGNKNIPLHLDVVGSPTVLNDGATPNELLLRITNTSDKALSLSSNAQQPSTFSVTVDGQPASSVVEWALAEMETLENVQLQWGVVAIANAATSSTSIPLTTPLLTPLAAKTAINIIPPPQQHGSVIATSLSQACDAGASSLTLSSSESVVAGSAIVVTNNGQQNWLAPAITTEAASKIWKMTNSSQASIAPGGSLVCYLANLVTGVKSGSTTIAINYCNIPGYWDGTLQTTVQKGPLVEREGSVGIAMNTPAYTLDIQGDARVAKTVRAGAGPSLLLENAGGSEGASAGVFFKTYSTEGQAPASGIVAQDNGNYSNDILFQTKNSGGNNNPLTTRMTLDADGNLDVTGTITGTGMVPPYAIIMQSGSISDYDSSGKGNSGTAYDGWAICNGNNGTPNLQDRFIVGAGSDAGAYSSGGPDNHNHSVNPPGQTFTTSTNGDHSHGMPSAWYNRNLSCGKHTGIDRDGKDVNTEQTSTEGNHNHTVDVNISSFNSGTYNGLNRPKYYALYFIMRLAS